MSYQLSIALVTRNRPESLDQTLRSLRAQSTQPFEVLVSDDSEGLELINANKEIANRYHCKYLVGPQHGLYSNRNFVASHCSGTHIRTMDDDHEFPENHILECIKAIEKDDKAIWTIGEYAANTLDRLLPAPIPGQLHPQGYSYAPENIDNGYYGISCGATIYPRSVIEKKILNLDIYKFGILYLEYGLRLFEKGFKIKNLDTTYVIHHQDIDNSISIIRSKPGLEIIGGAKVLSILMLSFHYRKTFSNQANSIIQIVKDIILGKYSIRTVIDATKHFRSLSKTVE